MPTQQQYTKHFLIAMALLLLAMVLVFRVPHGKTMPLQQELTNFPQQIGEWQGGPHEPFDQVILDVLRVDNYLNRTYYQPGEDWISLYIGYFTDQLEGKTIHSPRNCMPGSGWNFTQKQDVSIPIEGDRPLTVQAVRAVLVNGEERLLTYYWYQSRGRFVTSEYWHKIYLVLDAIRHQRTDGALVRVLAPIPKDAGPEEIDAIDAQLQDFIRQFTSALQDDYFPPGVNI